MPAEFGVHFLPPMKNVPKRTKMHLNEVDLANNEFCKTQIQLRQPQNFLEKMLFFDFLLHGSRSKRNCLVMTTIKPC